MGLSFDQPPQPGARHQDVMAAAGAFKADVSPQPGHLPFVTTAGMRFFQAQQLADGEVHGSVRFLVALPGRLDKVHSTHDASGCFPGSAGEIFAAGGV